MKSRVAVVTFLLVGLSLSLYFLFSWLSRTHRVSSDGYEYVIERISQSGFRDMTDWDVPIEERLVNSLGFQPNSDGTLILYQTGVNGSEVWLFDAASRDSRLIYRLSDTPDREYLVSLYNFNAFWVGTYDGVIVTEYGGDFGPYRVFYYDLAGAALRELPASLFIHPEWNLNAEGVLGSPPGSPLLVVRSAEDEDQADGLYLSSLSGKRMAKIFSGRRGVWGFVGCSERGLLFHEYIGPPNGFGETGNKIHFYDLSTRASALVPAGVLARLPMFRPGPGSVTFVDKDPRDQAWYLKEYATDGTGRVGTLLKLAEGRGGYGHPSYCWSIDGRKLFIIDPHQ